MGRKVSFADMANDPVQDQPGVDTRPQARWLSLDRCLSNPRNPRESVGDLGDLATIKDRQLQSCLAITRAAYLKLWPEDAQTLGGAPEDVVFVNGNRRLAAAWKYGRDELLVVTDDTVATSQAAVLRAAYDENAGRTDLDPIEEARVVMDIVATYATAKEAASAEGWSEPWISHRKNLLKIHPELREAVRAKARGAEGLAIRDARRLGAVKGIENMSLAEQREALASLLRADESKAAARKAPLPKPSKAEAAARSGSPGAGEFSAENSGGRSVPDQRQDDSAMAHADNSVISEPKDERILVDVRHLPRVPWNNGRRVAELAAEKMRDEQREILVECLFGMIPAERREAVLEKLLGATEA
ncbi:ParB/RepB/Spo0J family partition protein [Streptomyces goshikiensis]|uniref:ParB/RepB/Spo0J family partition protein n=1 Tax=Streptomyces goshikiensis TaxID=1942 RepID=UPI0036C901A2